MAICNVFNEITKKTGTFFTFSQYLEDLTQWDTQSTYYRVVPSKFVVLELPKLEDGNEKLPKILQNYFENGCALWREDKKWNPEYSTTLFWNALFDKEIILKDESSQEILNIKYVGDINLQSYNQHNGMGYSEIYCHIPNDAPEYVYTFNTENVESGGSKTSGETISGYNLGQLNGWEKIEEDITYIYNQKYNFSWDKSDLKTAKKLTDLYEFNSIIVLYDIYNQNSKIYSGIPLGMYVTSTYDGDGAMQNPITKYVSCDDIYNSGTSYGLRICSRFMATPNQDNYIIRDVELDNGGYSNMSTVLSKISESQNKIDEVVSKMYNCVQQHKDTLAIFKNNRTNVPYIKEINGENYWFVNGRAINPVNSKIGCSCDSYTLDELKHLMSETNHGLSVSLTPTETVFNELASDSKIDLTWEISYNGATIVPDKAILIFKYLDEDKNKRKDVTHAGGLNGITVDKDLYSIELEAEYKSLKASSSINILFTLPTYFGVVEINNDILGNTGADDHIYNGYLGNMPDGWLDQLNQIAIDWESVNPFEKLNKFIETHKITTNSNHSHICLVYPTYAPYNQQKTKSPEVEYIIDESGYVYYLKTQDDLYNDYDMTTINIKYGNTGDFKYNIYISEASVSLENYVLKFK